MLANITSESSHCFRKGNRNSGRRLCIMVCPSFWEDYYMLIYTHCWELMNSVGSHGSSSLPFVMKVMVCHFVSDSHEVMTALIVVLPLIVVVEISLQLHGSLLLSNCFSSSIRFVESQIWTGKARNMCVNADHMSCFWKCRWQWGLLRNVEPFFRTFLHKAYMVRSCTFLQIFLYHFNIESKCLCLQLRRGQQRVNKTG